MTEPSPDVLSWLDRMVAIDTTSRDSNLPLLDIVAEHARTLGLEPHLFPTPDGTKANLVVTVPDADGNTDGGVMLSGHADVVPVDGQDWSSDPFTLTERDGLLYGRGTTDMKAFDAVIVNALTELVAKPLSEPVHIALSHDEEVGCIGAPGLVAGLRSVGIQPRVCFVGEPTSMRMIRAHKSITRVDVVARGLAAHSSLTPQGVNAIEYVALAIRYWRERAERWRDEGPFDEAYPVPHTTASVNMVSGGNGVNIVPAECTAKLEFRAIAEDDVDAEIEALRAYCAELDAQMKAENPAAGIEVKVVSSSPGLDTPEDDPAVELGRALGLEVQADKVTYGTEAGIYSEAGISTVVCGPGNIEQAHKPDEFIDPEQIAACEEFIGRLVEHLRA